MTNDQTFTFKNLIISFLKEHKSIFVLYIIYLLMIPIMDIGIPHVLGKIIKSVKNNSLDKKYIYILIGLILLSQVVTSLNDFIESRLYPRFQTYMSNKVITYVFHKSETNLQDIFTGKVISILGNIPRTMYNLMETIRLVFIPQVLVAIVVIVYFMIYNVNMGLIVVIGLILYYLMLYLTLTECHTIASDREKFIIDVSEIIDDIFSNIAVIFNSGRNKQELNNTIVYYKNFEKLSEKALICMLKYKYMLTPILVCLIFIFILYGYHQAQQKKIEYETYIVFIIIFMYVFGNILKSVGIIKDTTIRWGIVEQNLKLFTSMESNKQTADTNKILTIDDNNTRDPNQIITFEHVDYFYIDNVSKYKIKRITLHDFNLVINQGETVLLVGKIGQGKSTILKLLMNFLQPDAGKIYYKNIEINKINPRELRRNIGMIPQNPVLFNRTLFENIVYCKPDTSKQQVVVLLKQLGLESIFDPDRLDMPVGKHGSRLSGGQRQIVWMLRVLLMNPEVILMDEPTASIDYKTKEFINNLFDMDIMKNKTVIIVSHDRSLDKYADRIVAI